MVEQAVKYKIGSILYAIQANKPGVTAYEIVEEVTKRTSSGTNTSYLVTCIDWDVGAQQDLSTVKDEIFTSLGDVRKELLKRSTAAIDHLLSLVERRTTKWNVSIVERDSSPFCIVAFDRLGETNNARYDIAKRMFLDAIPSDRSKQEYVEIVCMLLKQQYKGSIDGKQEEVEQA